MPERQPVVPSQSYYTEDADLLRQHIRDLEVHRDDHAATATRLRVELEDAQNERAETEELRSQEVRHCQQQVAGLLEERDVWRKKAGELHQRAMGLQVEVKRLTEAAEKAREE
jgi:uncharacterized coiled-coil DUF342 family protein